MATDGLPETDALVRLCAEEWSLPDVGRLTRLPDQPGSGAVFRIETSAGTFALKRHLRTYRADDVERIAQATALLAGRGLPAPTYRRTLGGQAAAMQRGYLYSLRRWVDGAPQERRNLGAEAMAKLGRILGWCHRLLADQTPGATFDWVEGSAASARALGRIVDLTSEGHGHRDRDRRVVEILHGRQRLLATAGDLSSVVDRCPVQVVHGDYHFANVIFGEDGDLAGLIDVEAYTQRRVREVYRAIAFSQRPSASAEIDAAAARAFVEGYLRESPLTAIELRRGAAILRWRMLRSTNDLTAYAKRREDAGLFERIEWAQGMIEWLERHGDALGAELAGLSDVA